MKNKTFLLTSIIFTLGIGFVFAMSPSKDTMPAQVEEVKAIDSVATEVNNKICPLSGEKVGEMGDIVKVQHQGRVYNLCCAMCKKDFDKDPQKYSKIADEEVAGQVQ